MLDVIKHKLPFIGGSKLFSSQNGCTSAYRFRSAIVGGRHINNRRQEVTEEGH